uniref:Uncharacterized protein n=1 Tax=Anguilla anguilla TaxID=7936 RepID=A0A0E9PED1_ANGAN
MRKLRNTSGSNRRNIWLYPISSVVVS